jgi:hypothetical protein
MSLPYSTRRARLCSVARTFGTHFVITANALDDGRSLWLRADRTWTASFAEAHATDDDAEREALLALAKSQERIVCDPYAAKVELSEHGPIATTARERIRALGPTTPLRRPDATDRLTA